MKYVHKSSGKVETFNSKKLLKSVNRSLISNHYSPTKANEIAEAVTENVVRWISKKTEVTNVDIRQQAYKQIAKYDKNVALLYKKHKDLW